MKDIIRVGMFVAVEEPSGKTTKVIGSVIKGITKRYEKQIDKIVNFIVDEVILEDSKDEEVKK